MQKSRPLGVTILAYWALAGSGAMFVSNAINLAGYGFIAPTGFIAGPLGGVYAINSYVALPIAAFLALVGLHTLQGRRWAWFANVGMSIAALVQPVVSILVAALYGPVRGSEGINIFVPGYVASIFGAIRLYYLFRSHVREYFGARSPPVKTQSA